VDAVADPDLIQGQPMSDVGKVIRPLQKEDVPQVAGLYELVFRSGSRTPPTGLIGYFERTLLDDPWADPEIPSLVYADEHGQVTGFIGSYVRRLSLEGKPLRMALSGQLMSDPVTRNRAVGSLLLRQFLAGPQDLTMTDGAIQHTRRLWTGLGGSIGHLSSITWLRPFHWRSLADLALERLDMKAWRLVAAPAVSAGQAMANRLPRLSLRVAPPSTSAEELTPQVVLEHLPAVSDGRVLRPDYDEQFLGWLFEEMAAVRSRGELVKRLIRDRRGQVLGWYVAYLQRHGLSQVMQLAAKQRYAGAVLDHLFYEAQSAEVAVLTGQYEPFLMETLSQRERYCFIHLSGNFLVHSRIPEVLGPILQGQAMVTRMEGERWMGHHVESFT
jgi:hypothetical protein